MINCSVDAYHGMQDLTLQLAQSSKEVEDRSKLKKLSRLQSLLKSMTGLKKLNICFSQADGYDCYFSHEQVLPSDGRWMGLISLQISGMNTPAKDLVQLLTMRMPNLQLLHLSEIELVDGRWEGVIEGMKRSMHLGFFSCEACFGPWGVGCQDFTAVYFEVGSDSVVGQYVLCGGRHPCLLPDERDEASKKYLSAPWL